MYDEYDHTDFNFLAYFLARLTAANFFSGVSAVQVLMSALYWGAGAFFMYWCRELAYDDVITRRHRLYKHNRLLVILKSTTGPALMLMVPAVFFGSKETYWGAVIAMLGAAIIGIVTAERVKIESDPDVDAIKRLIKW